MQPVMDSPRGVLVTDLGEDPNEFPHALHHNPVALLNMTHDLPKGEDLANGHICRRNRGGERSQVRYRLLVEDETQPPKCTDIETSHCESSQEERNM